MIFINEPLSQEQISISYYTNLRLKVSLYLILGRSIFKLITSISALRF